MALHQKSPTFGRKPEVVTKWAKPNITEMCVVGKETVAAASGCHVVFYNVETGIRTWYTANSKEKGDGVACISGHRTLPFVAFAENCLYPRIMVFFYPALDAPVTVLKGGALNSYQSIVFSETEYLIALTGIPDFSIVVWAWRNGSKVACKPCGIDLLNQRLSLGSPILICQTSGDSKQLIVWELNVSATVCCLSRKEVAGPSKAHQPLMSCFSADGTLVYIDTLGNIYQVNMEELNVSLEATWREESQSQPNKDILPCVITYKHGVIVSGGYDTLKSFSRAAEWKEQWTIELTSAIVSLGYLMDSDQVIGWTEKGEIVEVDFSKNPPQVSVLYVIGMNFIDAVMVTAEPSCVVSINECNILQVWSKSTGQLLGQLDLQESVKDTRQLSRPKSLSSNPRYPYVGVTMSFGLIFLVNVINPEEPTVLAQFLLCSEDINLLHFFGGDLFTALSQKIGRVFLIQGKPGSSMNVIGHVLLEKALVDVLLTGDKARPLLAHVRTEPCCQSGNVFQILKMDAGKLVGGTVMKSDRIYTQLVPALDQRYYAAGHRSSKLHVLQINLEQGSITHLESIVSGHQLLHFRINDHGDIGDRGDTGLLTSGGGGITILRPPGPPDAAATIQNTAVVISHHRGEGGVKRATQDATGDYVLTLGENGTLVMVVIKRQGKEPAESGAPGSETVALFSRKTQGFLLEGEDMGLNWLEYQEKMRVDAERLAAAKERDQILSEFSQLRSKIKTMLDSNETAPAEERLPVSAFDLDMDERENEMEQARDDREALRSTMIAETTVRNRLSELIIKECWEKLSVKPTSISSLLGTTRVDNYPLYPELTENTSLLESIQERRKLEMKVSKEEIFHPWVSQNYTEERSQSSTGSIGSQKIAPVDEKSRMMEALMREENGDGDAEATIADEDESPLTLTGTTIYRFVEPSKYIITQMELNTYIQSTSLIVLLRNEKRKVMEWFNDEFNLAYAAKEREMTNVHGLHNKIRHIFKELYTTCGAEQPGQEPKAIEWSQYEKPERILTVEDSELSVRPYGWTPPDDQQEHLDDEDMNFRRKALLKMMGGVLEVRWEDELKKDVLKPKFMLEKEPEDYTEDEVRQSLEYQKKVDHLMNEREHYRNILLSQYRKVKFALKESNVKFEQRLSALRELKLKVDSATAQTTLRIVRSQLMNTRRYNLAQREARIKEQISQNQKMLSEEQAMEMQMLDAASETRTSYDAQVSRDRYLEIRFKKEFPDVSSVQMELLQRAYRRRPKMQRAIMSSHLLNELGRCVVASKKPAHLPHESLEILKGIDSLDSVANVPTNVSADMWTNLCRLRRQRIESELKVKALMLQIVEADNTVAILHRSVRALKERDRELHSRLKRLHEEQLHFERDIEIQLVLKQGIVEIPMSGRMVDFENCIMIDRTDVAKLNDVIVEAGKKKLQAMRSDCNFRRGIIYKEWEHRKMVMRIEDTEDELNAILTAKVPKEGQEWLTKRLRGIAEDKQSQSFDKEIARIKSGFEKYIRELARAVKDYDDRIGAQNRINEKLQTVINDVNLQVRQLQATYDPDVFKSYQEARRRKMELWLEKSSLVIQVREMDIELRCLRNELNILHRRHYPILKSRPRTVPWSCC